MNKKTVKAVVPTMSFLEKLRRLTDGNLHGQCWIEVAKWALARTENPDSFGPIYKAHLAALEAVQKVNDEYGYLVDFDLRYNIGMNLEDNMRRDFGDHVVDEINKNR